MFLEFVPVSSLQTLKNYCSTGVAFASRNNEAFANSAFSHKGSIDILGAKETAWLVY